MAIADQVADIFGETKYSISFFTAGQKINLNDKLADLNIGYFKDPKFQQNQVLCLKGGVDAPKIFNRFKHVDSPERLLSYIANEEAFDAICFIPKKSIKFAGFSVYQVLGADMQPQDFKCFYKIKIGAETWPEKEEDIAVSQVENKMADIIFPKEVPVKAGLQVHIGVRFHEGENFFCQTWLGYGGEEYRRIRTNEECIYDIIDSTECSKGETDHTFGQIPRIHYFDGK